MSKEDYDYGQMRLTSRISSVVVPLAGGPILAAAEGRCGVRFYSPATNRVTISNRGVPALDDGLNAYPLTARGPEFCMAINGSITEGPFFGIAAVADQTIGVLETFRSDAKGLVR